VRCPSSGLFKAIESKAFSREENWDVLVEKSGAKAYNYQDYEQFQNLFLPEWSHLATKDAQFFTRELIKIMQSEGALTNSKNQLIMLFNSLSFVLFLVIVLVLYYSKFLNWTSRKKACCYLLVIFFMVYGIRL
jgi:membrane-associated HD superfamily phosphohydrolase